MGGRRDTGLPDGGDGGRDGEGGGRDGEGAAAATVRAAAATVRAPAPASSCVASPAARVRQIREDEMWAAAGVVRLCLIWLEIG